MAILINFAVTTHQVKILCFCQNSDGKGDSKGKKTPSKPLKILDEDDEDLSALKDPSEKVSKTSSKCVLSSTS